MNHRCTCYDFQMFDSIVQIVDFIRMACFDHGDAQKQCLPYNDYHCDVIEGSFKRVIDRLRCVLGHFVLCWCEFSWEDSTNWNDHNTYTHTHTHIHIHSLQYWCFKRTLISTSKYPLHCVKWCENDKIHAIWIREKKTDSLKNEINELALNKKPCTLWCNNDGTDKELNLCYAQHRSEDITTNYCKTHIKCNENIFSPMRLCRLIIFFLFSWILMRWLFTFKLFQFQHFQILFLFLLFFLFWLWFSHSLPDFPRTISSKRNDNYLYVYIYIIFSLFVLLQTWNRL